MKNSKLGSNEHHELLAVRHPAPKKLISLRRHKVSEATIENLGFAGNPVTRGTLSAPGTAMACLKEVGEKPGLQMNLASWQIMPCLHILLAVFQGNV